MATITELDLNIAFARLASIGQAPVRIYIGTRDCCSVPEISADQIYNGVPVTLSGLGMFSRVVGDAGGSWKLGSR